MDDGKLMSLVAGKQRSLLMAGDDGEVYDEKPQRYTEDTEQHLILCSSKTKCQ